MLIISLVILECRIVSCKILKTKWNSQQWEINEIHISKLLPHVDKENITHSNNFKLINIENYKHTSAKVPEVSSYLFFIL